MDGPERVRQRADVGGDSIPEPGYRGPVLRDRRTQALDRDVAAEVENLVTGALEDVGDHAQTERVVLALDAREQHPRKGALRDPPGAERLDETDQDALADRRGQVLVRDGDRLALPELAEPDHRWDHDERMDRLGRHAHRERVVYNPLSRSAIPDAEDVAEAPGQGVRPRDLDSRVSRQLAPRLRSGPRPRLPPAGSLSGALRLPAGADVSAQKGGAVLAAGGGVRPITQQG